MSLSNNLKGYQIVFTKNANKDLNTINKNDTNSILKKLKSLVSGNDNIDTKKMSGSKKAYRLKHGDYRVIYEIYHKKIIVLVVKVGHRKNVYKRKTWE